MALPDKPDTAPDALSECDHEWDDHWMVQYRGWVPQYEVRYCLKCSEPERRMSDLPIMRASGPVGFHWEPFLGE